MRIHWFLPTAGDGRDIVAGEQAAATVVAERPPDLAYLSQVARAAERLGFAGVLTPTGTFCEDAWLTTAALIGETSVLRFLVAFRPGLISPTLAARMAATYQRLSGGRLMLNVVTGGDSAEQRRFGDHLDHDRRYARTAEFLQVLRRAWSGSPYTFTGTHYAVADATVRAAPDPVPPVFFGGSSAPALAVAAAHADTYMTWGEPPDAVAVAAKLHRVRALAGDRRLTFGIRLHVLSRDTAAEAWSEARALLARVPPATIAAARERFARSESEGQRRMAALTDGDSLEIVPNLWAGYTGVLKVLLDRLPAGGLAGITAVPVVTAGVRPQADAAAALLAQLLRELGADVVEPLAVTETGLADASALAETYAAGRAW